MTGPLKQVAVKSSSPAMFAALDLDEQIDDIAAWVERHPEPWPLYGKLWAWTEAHSCPPNPEDLTDRELFTVLHRAVAARIVARSLADAGWTFEQLTLTDTIPTRKAA